MRLSNILFFLSLLSYYPVKSQSKDYRNLITQIRIGDTITCGNSSYTVFLDELKVAKKKVIYIITPSDCRGCLLQTKAFNNTINQFMNVDQLLIIQDASESLANKIKSEYGLKNIQTIAEPNNSDFFNNTFKLQFTPAIFLLDENNTIIDYDKIDGKHLKAENINKYFVGEIDFKLINKFKLTYKDSEYVSGQLQKLAYDNQKQIYYAYDKTFNTLLKINSDGKILSMIKKSDSSSVSLLKPKQLIVPDKENTNYDLIVFDFNLINNIGFKIKYVKFKEGNEQGSLFKYQNIKFDKKINPEPDILLEFNDKHILSLMPMKNDWRDTTTILNFKPVAVLKNLENSEQYLNPIKSIDIDSSFLKCFNIQAADSRFSSRTFPKLIKISKDYFGFYYGEINKLHLLDTNLNYVKTISLGLDHFTEFDCHQNISKSVINDIICHNDTLYIIYLKNVWTSESNYTKFEEKNFFMQILDMKGNPLTKATSIPPNATLPIVISRNNNICFVDNAEGKYTLSLYKLNY